MEYKIEKVTKNNEEIIYELFEYEEGVIWSFMERSTSIQYLKNKIEFLKDNEEKSREIVKLD